MNLLAELLNPQLVVADLAATTKAGVLEELAALLCSHAPCANGQLRQEAVVSVLLERERLGSTGIGDGVALPHGKLPGLEGVLLGLGRSAAGIDFESVDGRPAHLIFLLLTPEGSTRHLQALAALARLLQEAELRRGLLAAASAQAMYQEMQRALGIKD